MLEDSEYRVCRAPRDLQPDACGGNIPAVPGWWLQGRVDHRAGEHLCLVPGHRGQERAKRGVVAHARIEHLQDEEKRGANDHPVDREDRAAKRMIGTRDDGRHDGACRVEFSIPSRTARSASALTAPAIRQRGASRARRPGRAPRRAGLYPLRRGGRRVRVGYGRSGLRTSWACWQ